MSVIPFPKRAELHVSVSQVKSWLICSRRYLYRYIRGVEPEHRSPNLVLGSAVHEALAAFYVGVKAGQVPGVDELVAHFTDAWARGLQGDPPLLLPDGVTAGNIEDQGIGLVKAFAEYAAVPEKVVSVEQLFAVDIADPKTGELIEEQLVGYLDAVVIEGGKQLILEHKTAARRWSQDQLDYDIQAAVYLAVTGAEKLRFQVLLKTKTPGFVTHDVTRTEEAKTEAFEIVCRVLDAIRAGISWPNRGWQCRTCEYRRRCGGAA